MYWPPEIDRYHMTWLAKHLSLGVYFNLFSTQFEGGWAKHTMAGSIKGVIKDGMSRKFDMSMLGKSALSLTDVYNADFKMLGEVDSEGTSDFRCLVPIFLLDTVFFPEVFVLQRELCSKPRKSFLEMKAFDPLESLYNGTSPLTLNDDLHFPKPWERHHPVHGGLCLLCLCLLCEWLEPKEF